jgi:ubiquinone/menaquinone biosynthesis C-methylase UbiE
VSAAQTDPKAAAQERFADSDWNQRGLDLVMRCATDPPLVVRGLVDAIKERTPAGGRVIELGFGGGWLLEELIAAGLDATLDGLDMSPGMARSAHDRFAADARIVTGDMEALPYRDAAFDVVATCWTLYFMRDIDRALKEVTRVLRAGGRLVVGVNAPDHEAECGELVSAAIESMLGNVDIEHDVGRRFDMETGEAYMRRHFANVELRRWHGEMVLTDPDDMDELWPKWEPALFSKEEQQAVRGEFLRVGRERLERDGELRIRRRNGAFIGDLA